MIFVNMTDKALSGWGQAERGRSLYCVECRTREHSRPAAPTVGTAEDRSEMKYITLAGQPRRMQPGDHRKIVLFDSLGAVWKKYYVEDSNV